MAGCLTRVPLCWGEDEEQGKEGVRLLAGVWMLCWRMNEVINMQGIECPPREARKEQQQLVFCERE